MLYFPLFTADAIDLTNPYFNMYLRHFTLHVSHQEVL